MQRTTRTTGNVTASGNALLNVGDHIRTAVHDSVINLVQNFYVEGAWSREERVWAAVEGVQLFTMEREKSTNQGSPEPMTSTINRSLPTLIPTNTFQYAPINGQNQIRLFHLFPGKDAEPLRGELVAVDYPPVNASPSEIQAWKRDETSYEAVSWEWGKDQEKFELEILSQSRPWSPGDDPNPRTSKIRIRTNLYSALSNLRDPNKVRILWVDAMCINQENYHEKLDQVVLLPTIFQRAKNVCVYLGPETADRLRAFEFIQGLVKLRDIDNYIKDPRTPDRAESLFKLMEMPLLSRRWVVQEIVLAQRASLHCGALEVDFSEFMDAVTLFESKSKEISRIHTPLYTHGKSSLGDIRATRAYTLVTAINCSFGRTTDEAEIRRYSTLGDLVITFSAFLTVDPRDAIYAILELGRDSHMENLGERPICPDYSKSLKDVLTEFVSYYINTNKSLDVICHPWGPVFLPSKWMHLRDPEEDMNIPSWIIPSVKSAFAPRKNGRYHRINADNLVGPAGRKTYDASAGMNPIVEFDDMKRMLATGVRLGNISSLQCRAIQGIIPDEWLKLGGCYNKSGEIKLPPEGFWRTLVANRTPNGEIAPNWYGKALFDCLNHPLFDGEDFIVQTLLDSDEPPITKEVLERVQSVIWNRRIFVVENSNLASKIDHEESDIPSSERDNHSETLIGLAGRWVQDGDCVVVLYGCSVPIVLHRDDADGSYTFQGECYVHEVMEGELIWGSASTDPRIEQFRLK